MDSNLSHKLTNVALSTTYIPPADADEKTELGKELRAIADLVCSTIFTYLAGAMRAPACPTRFKHLTTSSGPHSFHVPG